MGMNVNQLAILFYVGDSMSFSKAAEFLGCSKAHISKQISELERDLGTPLLHRNTRSVRFTFEGEILFEYAKQMVIAFKNAEQAISSLQHKVTGNLKITAPSAFTDYVLSDYLSDFFHEHPELTIDMQITGELLNLVEEKIDLAIRLTHEPPLDRVATRIGSYRMVLCASYPYLEKHGEPVIPTQLSHHSCLVFATQRSKLKWPFLFKNENLNIDVRPTLISNNSKTVLSAMMNGVGIARLPDYVVRDCLAHERIKLVLSDYYPPEIPIYAIYSQSRIIPPKIHAFIKFLKTLPCNQSSGIGK